MTMMKTDVKKELSSFAQTTSMKGVPRIIKSPDICLRVVWLVCVVCFVSIAIYQSTLVLMSYFSYPVNTLINEQVLHPTSMGGRMPDVTVCSSLPFSSSRPAWQGITAVKTYANLVKNLTRGSDEGKGNSKKWGAQHQQNDKANSPGTTPQQLSGNNPQQNNAGQQQNPSGPQQNNAGQQQNPSGPQQNNAGQQQNPSGPQQSSTGPLPGDGGKGPAGKQLLISTDTLERELLTPRGYYQFLGYTTACQISHKESDLIRECELLAGPASMDLELDCGTYANATLFQHPDFFNCFTISLNHNKLTSSQAVYGIAFTVFLDTGSGKFLEHLRYTGDDNVSKGVKVILHEAGTMPRVSKSIDTLPGHMTQIPFTRTERVRLEEPYGNCTLSFEKMTMRAHSSGNTTYQYTMEMCLMTCLSKHIQATCNCTDVSTAIPPQDTEEYPFCGRLEGTLEEMTDRISCAKREASDYDGCYDQCPPACSEVSHRVTPSSLDWPNYGKAIDLMRQEVETPKSMILKPDSPFHQARHNRSEFARLARETDLVDEHFIRVQVHFEEGKVMVIQDVPAMTLVSMVSQLGAVLNLWAGITVILAVEVVELLYTLVRRWGRQLQQDTRTAFNGNSVHAQETPTTEDGSTKSSTTTKLGFRRPSLLKGNMGFANF